MPNENLTEIITVIDRSGSMLHIKHDMEGGLKSFINDQAKQPGEARLSIYTFDDLYETFCEGAELSAVNDFALVPRNRTALFDAIGHTINAVGIRLAALAESDRPGKVVVIIITDGHENASKEFTLKQISEMVTHQSTKYSWQFAFLGANIDSFAAGGSLGVSRASTMNYAPTKRGTEVMFDALNAGMSTYRSVKTANASLSLQAEDDTDTKKEI